MNDGERIRLERERARQNAADQAHISATHCHQCGKKLVSNGQYLYCEYGCPSRKYWEELCAIHSRMYAPRGPCPMDDDAESDGLVALQEESAYYRHPD